MIKRIFNRIRKGRKSRLVLLVVIILVILPLAINTLLSLRTSKAAWWDETWAYRKKISIANSSGGTLTDFQVNVSLNTSTPISAGKMQSDCDDLRITDSAGTVLTYWLESGCNSTATSVWVKIPSIPTTGITVLAYYGNPSVSSVSSGANTFLYFDDFSTDTSASYTTTSGSFAITGGEMNITGVSNDSAIIALTTQSPPASYTTEARMKMTTDIGGNSDSRVGLLGFQTTVGSSTTGYVTQFGTLSGSPSVGIEKLNVSHLATTASSYSTGTYYLIKGKFASGALTATHERTTNATSTDSTYTSGYFGLRTYDSHGSVDWWFVRAYSATEPTAGSAGVEERSPGKPIAYWKLDDPPTQTITKPIAKIEQYINIIDQEFSTTTGEFLPNGSDANSLGLFNWDADKYPNATAVYFEVSAKDSHSSNVGYFTLFNEAGTELSASQISTDSLASDYGFYQSANIITNLVDGTDYTVRIKPNSAGSLSGVKSARITIIQSAAPVTQTETTVELGANETTTQTSYTNLTNKKIWLYNSSLFNPTPTVYFEATLANNTGGSIAYAALYTDGATCSSVVSGSEVSVTGTSWDLARSGPITLTSNTQYSVCIKADANTAKIANARIILDQQDSAGIKAAETAYQLVDYASTDTDGYTGQKFFGYYDPSNIEFEHAMPSYFESTIKTSAGTGNARLSNTSDTAVITNSTLTTTSTTYERQRSSDLGLYLPVTAKQIDTDISNSGNTTTVAGSFLLVQNNYSYVNAAADSTGNENHLSSSGSSFETTGCPSASCYRFDGTNDYLRGDDYQALDFASSDQFTISGWFRHSSQISGTDTIISKYNATAGGYKLYLNSAGQLIFAVDDDSSWGPDDSATSPNSYTDNTWHYFTAIKNGVSSISLYVDTVKVADDQSISATGTLENTNLIYIGIDGDQSSSPWTGNLDEIKVYAYARSVNEIKSDYTRGQTAFGGGNLQSLTNGLALHWKMDESAANSCDDTNDSCDSSGNFNQGAWSGNTAVAGGKYGNGLNFDGTYDQVATASANAIPPSTWQNRLKLTFDNSAASEDLNYFPVLVKLNSGRIDYSKTKDAGEDIRFYDSNGTTALPYEIEKWDESGTSLVWVNVPNIPTGSTTDYIWLYYNNPGAADAQAPSDVWNNDYELIYHLPNGTALSAIDSTTSDNDGTITGATATAGQIDGGADYNGSQYIYKTTPVNLPTGTAARTSEAWIKFGSTTTSRALGGWGANSGSGDRWNFWYDSGSMLGVENQGYGGVFSFTYDTNWHHLAATSAQGNTSMADILLYLDGELQTTSTVGGANTINTSGSEFALATIPGAVNNNNWTGSMDEFRVSSIVRPASWIKASYMTGADTFNTYGGEEAILAESASLTLSFFVNPDTIDSAQRILASRGSSPSFDWVVALSATDSGKLWYTADGLTDQGTSNGALSTTSWQHVAMVANGTNTKIYINGQFDSETANSGTLSGSGNVSVGAAANGTQGYDGKIDDFRIYNRALNETEIRQLAGLGSSSVAPGPVAWWKLDEKSGGYAYDSTANSSTATLTGGMTDADWVRGKYSNALDFDGDSEYLLIADNSVLDVGGGDWTVSLWAYLDNVESLQSIFDNGVWTTCGFYINYYNQRLYMSSKAAGGLIQAYTNTYPLAVSTWNYISLVRNGTSGKIYVNGVDVTASSGTFGDAAACTSSTYIGRTNPLHGVADQFLNGKLDDIKVYNYARTSGQVVEDMNAGHPAPGSPIGSAIAYWNFDEGYSTNANDNTDNNNDLTLNAASWTSGGKFGKAWNGTGGDFRLSKTTDPDLEFSATDSFTLSTWFKSDTAGTPADVEYLMADGVGAAGYALYIDGSGYACFGIDDDAAWGPDVASCNTTNVYDNTWHHVVGVRDVASDKNYVYVDGVLKDSDTDSTTGTLDSSPTFYIGDMDADNAGSGEEFAGDIDETKVYRLAMTEDQVKIEFNHGQASVFGANTDSSGNASWSDTDSYCPPGQTTACVAPVGEWKFDEKTGTTVNDSGGNGYNSTAFTGNTSWSKAKHGSGLSFDGDGDRITISDQNDFTITTTNQLTVEGWAKFNTVSVAQSIVSKYASGTDREWALNITSAGILNGEIINNAGGNYLVKTGATTLIASQWYHLAMTMDESNTTLTIYLNGVKEGTTTSPSGTIANNTTTAVTLGERTNGSLDVNGVIDDVKIYNYARTPAQIAWDYDRGAPVAWYKFDECSGAVLNNYGFSPTDSPVGNNATIYPVSSGNDAVGSCSSGDITEMWNNGTSGKYSASVDFDGGDDYGATSNASIIASNTSTYTNLSFGGWFKPATSPTSDTFIMKGNGNTTNEFRLTTDASAYPQCEIYYSAAWHVIAKKTTALASSAWTHLLCTYDGTNGRLYINGIQADYKADTNSVTSSSSSPLTLASDPNNGSRTGFFDGQIDEVKIWNYALSAQQVRTDYNRNSAVKF
ncbi:MAG TPA: DUF2341 domain-containing protein [Patescibacteria group bacterium]|nr:DUF2341 domain-containing protein [Patescibacteria group bacterium]